MSKIIVAVVSVVAITVFFVFGSNDQSDAVAGLQASASKAPVAKSKTSTLALPERTNNAWEMKPFKLKGLDGKQHTLSDWKGKVIVMNFWASWCGPCLIEMPDFIAYQKKYADKGLQFVGIGVDEERKLKNVKRTLGVNYPVLILDPMASGRLMAKWGNQTGIIPYTVVINKEGRIKYIHRGQMNKEDFEEYVVPLL